jgi:lysophospholipase L1-like esterase
MTALLAFTADLRARHPVRRARGQGGAALATLALILAGCSASSPDEAAAISAAARMGNATLPAPAARAKPVPMKGEATQGVLVQAGDSIGVGLGADNWAAIEHLGLPPGIKVHNVSVSGQWMLTGLGERDKNLFPNRDPDHASVLLIEQGTNDLMGGNSADYLYQNILRPFVAKAQEAGFYVAVNTILPRADDGWMSDPQHERERVDYNKLVRANAVGADTVIDVASDPEIGDRVDPALSPLFADRIHPNRQGQERLAKIYAAPIKLMLRYPPRAPAGV